MTFMKIQEGEDRMQRARHTQLLGLTAACTLRLAELCKCGTCVMGDSWFGIVKADVTMYQRGYELIVVIKQGHAL